MTTTITATSTATAVVPDSCSRYVGMWMQNFSTEADVQGWIDDMFSAYGDIITDLMVLAWDETTSPTDKFIGTSTLLNDSAVTIEGMTILDYMIQEAHARDIRLHLWVAIYPWAIWGGGAGPITTPFPNDATHRDSGGAGINMHEAHTRADIVAIIEDMITNNPDVDGINLDYIRTDGTVTVTTAEDVTQMIADIYTKLGELGDYELSACIKADLWAAASYKQNSWDWISNGYLNKAFLMGYWTSDGATRDLVGTYTSIPVGTVILYGAGNKNDGANDSTFKGKLYNMQIKNPNTNVGLFDYDAILSASEIQMVDEFDMNVLTISQTNITKISVEYGVSFTFALDGVDKTVLLDDYEHYNSSEHLQDYVESVHGAQPWVLCVRPTSTTIQLCARDYGDRT